MIAETVNINITLINITQPNDGIYEQNSPPIINCS